MTTRQFTFHFLSISPTTQLTPTVPDELKELAMTLTKTAKISLGILTLWPLVYPFLFIAFVIGTMLTTVSGGMRNGPDGAAFPAAFVVFFIIHLLTILFMFALMGVYLYILYNSDRVPADKKTLWAVILLFGNMLAMPVFFWIYVWPEDWPATPAKT